jgi:hypothetical protein
MANIKYDLNDLAEELASRLTEVVEQETLEQFFYEQHVEWFRDHLNDVGQLEREAKALGLLDDEDTLELI